MKKALSIRLLFPQSGFTLVELMTVIALLSIIAAIAIPQYLGYTRKAKQEVCVHNTQIALNIVKEEIAKTRNIGNIRQDIIKILNEGDKRNPLTGQGAAFISSGTQKSCQVLFSNLVSNKIPPVGTVVLIDGYEKDPADLTKLVQYQIPVKVE